MLRTLSHTAVRSSRNDTNFKANFSYTDCLQTACKLMWMKCSQWLVVSWNDCSALLALFSTRLNAPYRDATLAGIFSCYQWSWMSLIEKLHVSLAAENIHAVAQSFKAIYWRIKPRDKLMIWAMKHNYNANWAEFCLHPSYWIVIFTATTRERNGSKRYSFGRNWIN